MASNDVTDLELSSKFTDFIAESYQTALEFHKSKPDYSLLKFREINRVVINFSR
jgi:DNA phosphorothioation-dependent restriction protein DptG